MGATLLRAWNAPALVARVEIDAAAKAVVAAENAEVSDLAATEGGLAWTGLDRALPLPLSFDDAEIELAQVAGADLGGPRSAAARGGRAARRRVRAEDRRQTVGLRAADLARVSTSPATGPRCGGRRTPSGGRSARPRAPARPPRAARRCREGPAPRPPTPSPPWTRRPRPLDATRRSPCRGGIGSPPADEAPRQPGPRDGATDRLEPQASVVSNAPGVLFHAGGVLGPRLPCSRPGSRPRGPRRVAWQRSRTVRHRRASKRSTGSNPCSSARTARTRSEICRRCGWPGPG